MTVQVASLFQPTQLTAAAIVLGVVPSIQGIVYASGRIRFTNTDTTTHRVTFYAVPAGGFPRIDNCQMAAESIGPNTHIDADIPKLGPGATVQAFADTAGTVTASELAGVLIL